VAKIKWERVAIIADCCFLEDDRRRLMAIFQDEPRWRLSELAEFIKPSPGHTVKENILSYDSVKGIYGVWGKNQ